MPRTVKSVLVTGSKGFIAKNVRFRLAEAGGYEVLEFARGDSLDVLETAVQQADAIVHLAGENRPADAAAFAAVNLGLTEALCAAIRRRPRGLAKPLVVLASSRQAGGPGEYGASKLAAEEALKGLARSGDCDAVIFRFPGVFGKWSRPNYNSVVATFCHNIARDIDVEIHDPDLSLALVHVDDVVSAIVATFDTPVDSVIEGVVAPEYHLTVGELATHIRRFATSRVGLETERVGSGFLRALYSTFVSFLPVDKFAYAVPVHSDSRGSFVEMLRTPDCGQFSFFTALPGVTRGGHYHHVKTEKFLILQGEARFRFRHVATGIEHELVTSSARPEVVETVPGWAHDVTNTGSSVLIGMLWANEVFDRSRPDTFPSPL